MNKILLILLCLPMFGFGQNVYIPDANFKSALVSFPSINTNGDAEIQVSEATSFNGTIFCNNMNISDLTGIEAFTALYALDCSNNQLTSLDVSNNTALSYFYCGYNQLTILDVSSNTSLTEFHCDNNNLTTLDVRNGKNQTMHYDDDGPLGISAFDNPSLTCILVDNSVWCNANWDMSQMDLQHYFSDNCGGTTSIQELITTKELLKVTDLLGREIKETNQPLFYIYDDGTVEKRIVIE